MFKFFKFFKIKKKKKSLIYINKYIYIFEKINNFLI